MEDDDFFDDGPPKKSVGPSSLLKNLVGHGDNDSRDYTRDHHPPSYQSYGNDTVSKANSRLEPNTISRDYDDIPQAGSGNSTSSDVMSPIARKPPLPPSEGHRLAHSMNSSEYSVNRDDRCKNPELRLDLSNLSLVKSKKKRRKSSKKVDGNKVIFSEDDLSTKDANKSVSSEKPRNGKTKIKVPTGALKKKSKGRKKGSSDGHLYGDEGEDSCSTCQSSSSSSSATEILGDEVSEHSDVTSVSPLNSPHSHNRPRSSYHSAASASMAVPPRNSPASPARADDLFRLMRRLIDDVDKDQRIARSRGQPTWASYAAPDRSSTAWSGVSAEMRARHPTLGEIIQSLSRYNGPKSTKSNTSTAPSVASGAASAFTTSTALTTTSSQRTAQFEPPRRRTNAAINRDKRAREIAAENIRIYQRLQTVRASPDVSRDRQIADWHRQVTYGSGANPGAINPSERVAYGISPLAGLIASAGRGTKPMRPQSAVAYLNSSSPKASSITSETYHHAYQRSKGLDGSFAGSRPSSGSIHSRTSHNGHGEGSINGSIRGEAYLTGAEYHPESRRKKKKSRPISGHF